MGNKEAQVNWDDDDFLDVDECYERVRQLRREIHDERVRRDEWEKMYNQAIAGAKVERPREELAAETALADCGITGIYDQFSSPADAIEQMVRRLVQLEGGQALQNERQLRRETEQCYRAALTMARHRGDRLEKAEPLAALATEETAELLESMAQYWYQLELYDKAIALATRIRETLTK